MQQFRFTSRIRIHNALSICLFVFDCDFLCRAGGRTPVPPVGGGRGSRMPRGLMLRMVKIFWARADV